MAFTLPKTITPGTNENASDVQANDAALRDELNGVTQTATLKAGSMDPAFAKDNVEPAFERYKQIQASQATIVNGSGTYLFGYGSAGFATAASPGNATILYLDPADFTAGSRTNYWRIRAACFTNGTAPAMTFTVGLYPVSAVAGGPGAFTLTLGTVTSGSTVVFTTQATNTRAQGNSGDFAAPAAGYYALGMATSGGTQAVNSVVSLSAQLQYRQV